MDEKQLRAILCPNCKKLINSDEPSCPYCGMRAPGAKWKIAAGKLFKGDIVAYIIYANVFMYVISLLINPSGLGFSGNPLRFLSPSNQSLLLIGATGTIPIDRFGRLWTLVSANYLHGGLLHIFFNMMVLKQLAPLVLREYGASRMTIIYTLGGVGGYVVSYMFGVPFTIGASAAVCALIGAILYYGKSRGGVYGQSVFREMSRWVIMLALFGFIVPGINNWAHGGGIVSGAAMAFILGYNEKARENIFHRIFSAGLIAATVLVLAWGIISGFRLNF